MASLDKFRAVDIRLDKANEYYIETQFAKEGDYNGRDLVVQITNAGEVTSQTGVTLNLGWKHEAVGNKGLDPFEVVDASQGIFKISYPTEMLNAGTVVAVIQVVENTKITLTRNFKITVEKSPVDESAVVSENSFTVLQDALLTVNQYDNRIANVENTKVDKSTFEQNKNEVTAQLQQTSNSVTSIDSANADSPLRFINYVGNNENFHPKVLYFEDGWNGFQYWMAYSPYPKGNIAHENPCIAVSNDLIEWSVPEGLTNPLDNQPEGGYNSDPHIVYREDLDHMELWWRAFIGQRRIIYRRISTDGVNWSPRELMFDTEKGDHDLLSPTINFEDGKYRLWYIRQGYRYIYYTESIDGSATQWTDAITNGVDFYSEKLVPWHLDVTLTDVGHEYVISCYKHGLTPSSQDLYHVLETPDGEFTRPLPIIKRNKNVTAFDHNNIYRSSLLKIDDEYLVFYSATAPNNERSIALSRGTSVYGLNGANMSTGSAVVDTDRIVDFDATSIDRIEFFTDGECVVESLYKGQPGQRLVLDIAHANTRVTLVDGGYLALPNKANYSWDGLRNPIELIFTNNRWRILSHKNDTASVSVINTSTDLIDYDVSTTDIIRFDGSGVSEVHSLANPYTGKRVTLINASGNHVVKIIHNPNRIALPYNKDHILTNEQRVFELVYEGGTWKSGYPLFTRTLTITDTNIEELDVYGVSTLIINGTSPTTIHSLVNAANGDEINIVPISLDATPVTLKESGNFAFPEREDYEITGLRNPIKLIYASGLWRRIQ